MGVILINCCVLDLEVIYCIVLCFSGIIYGRILKQLLSFFICGYTGM